MATTAASPAHRKTVTIQVDAKGAIKSTEPEYFEISKSNQEEVIWRVTDPNVYFTVEFAGESPFYESQFSSDYPISGLVRRSVLGDPLKKYKYTVRTKNSEVDPGGVIMR